MKKSSLIVNILFAAVPFLFAFQFTSCKPGATGAASGDNAGADKAGLKVAYIKVDSLIVNYDLAQELHNSFTQKQEAYTKEYSEKRTKFEQKAVAFQEKVQRGGFLTQERAMQERDLLMSEEQQIAKLDQELSAKLAQLQSDNNKQLLDSLMNYVKTFNKDKKYDFILNSSEILVGADKFNITSQVLKGMNARYNSLKK